MHSLLNKYPLLVLKIPNCVNCSRICYFLDELNVSYTVVNVIDLDFDDTIDYLERVTNSRTFPMVFVKGKYIGNYKEIKRKYEVGLLSDIFRDELNVEIIYDFDG